MSDIFLCYSRSDLELATRLAQRLTLQGWSVFQDVETPVGQRWHKHIEKELHAARSVLALWSARSRESDYVLEEAEYGKRRDRLFPALIEAVDIPYGFGRLQTANLIGWKGEAEHPGLAQLLGALGMHLVVSPPPAGEGPGEREPRIPPTPQEKARAQRLLLPGQIYRDLLKDGGVGPQMLILPAGRFRMGSPTDEPDRRFSEGPQREVRIGESYALGVTSVTFDDYDRYCAAAGATKPKDHWGRGRMPAINVSWNDAQAYCAWLSQQSGRAYRLPSEAEWEYACRAGTSTPFYFGDSISTDQANFNGNHTDNGSVKGECRQQTTEVGSFPVNAFGLYDMHGNVWEWCQDAWHDDYQGAPEDGSAWEGQGDEARVLRGGSWDYGPSYCRAASRYHFTPADRYDDFGFRLCCASPIGNQFTLEGRSQEGAAADKPQYCGEKLSLDFQNVAVRAALQVIADFTGLNIIASDTVFGNVTLRLMDVPWDQALDIILRTKGLDKRTTGNVIWVAPRDELAAKEKLELEARQQIADLTAER